MGPTYYICDQQRWSYERGGISRGWSLKGGATVLASIYISKHAYIYSTCVRFFIPLCVSFIFNT